MLTTNPDSDPPVEEPIKLELRKHTKGPLRIGIAITVVYLVVVAFYVWDIRTLWGLKPEEMGSFLGGVFAPVAFMWLILGFFQQGEELRNSVDALRLQSEELRASVEQQKAMVGLTREQIDHIKRRDTDIEEDQSRRAQPRFSIVATGNSTIPGESKRRYTFYLVNTGAQTTDVRLSLNPKSEPFRWSIMLPGEQKEFHLAYDNSVDMTDNGKVVYLDALGVERIIALTVFGTNRGVSIDLSDRSIKSAIQS